MYTLTDPRSWSLRLFTLSLTRTSGCIPARPRVTSRLLARITRRIVEQVHPEKIVLFGSYAYGRPTRRSDIDLFVIMESDEPPLRRIDRVADAAEEPFLPMDVIVRTPSEVEERLRMGDSFVQKILGDGKVLYEGFRGTSSVTAKGAWIREW